MNKHLDLILDDFIIETKNIVSQLHKILETAEAGIEHADRLETYGQVVDRVVGGAKSLSVNLAPPNTIIQKIGDYAAVCKAVGYKASQIRGQNNFYEICVALLMDATDVLGEMILAIEKGDNLELKEVVSKTLIDRLRWVSGKFSAEFRESVSAKTERQKMNQEEIDALVSKLGLD